MRGKSSAGSKGKSNRNGLADSELLAGLGVGENPLIDQSHETEPKTLAESILEEEISQKICYNCEVEIQDSESIPCEICNGECHLSCLLDSENGMVCNACNASHNQILVDGDSEDKTDDECHSDSNTHNKTASDTLLATQRHENSLEHCLSHTYRTENQNKSCQTEGVSSVDFHKTPQKELNLKEKAVNKKEFELSQTSKQLITARTKIIALEKTVNELQKENDLLRTNLLLAQTCSNKKEEDGNRPAY